MELFHTSPVKIEAINSDGLFGEFLCCASRPYFMTVVANPVVYKIDLDESEVIEAIRFFYHEDAAKLQPLVERIMRIAGCDEGTAEDLLSGVQALADVAENCDYEQEFEIQRLQGLAGKTLGFRAVQTVDEQGTMWLVNMAGRESEMHVAKRS